MNSKSKIDNICFSNSKKIKEWEVEEIVDTNDEKIYFETPYMFLPFGLEKEYNNYILKLQFKGVKNNSNQEMIDFYNLIKNHEDTLITKKNIDKTQFKSQIIQKNDYDDLLIIKINKKFFNIDIFDDKGEIKNIFNLEKKSEIKCKIHVDSLWNNSKIYTSKFIVDKITIKT